MRINIKSIVLIIFCLFLFLELSAFSKAENRNNYTAQLVLVEKRVKIIRVDINRSRLEVAETGRGDTTTLLYVVIDGYTKVWHLNKRINWKSLKKGQLIMVKGGLRWDGKIKANDIYLIKKSPD
ncbi:MAG: hypothetical protein M1536_04260 [Firmicutes bacterium]|nr:hypothetical protein [Bacillota bacterium]